MKAAFWGDGGFKGVKKFTLEEQEAALVARLEACATIKKRDRNYSEEIKRSLKKIRWQIENKRLKGSADASK